MAGSLWFAIASSPPLLSFIHSQLKRDSLWRNADRVHPPDPLPPQTLLLIHQSQIFILSLSIWCSHFVGYVCSFRKRNSEGLCCASCFTSITTLSLRSYISRRSFSTLSLSLFSCFSHWCSHESSRLTAFCYRRSKLDCLTRDGRTTPELHLG